MPTPTSGTSKVKTQSKTAFVLALPPDLAVAEVVAKAAAAGLTITPNYVSNIRSSARIAAAKKKAAAKPKAAKKATSTKKAAAKKGAAPKPAATTVPTTAAAPALTATEFIKSQPREISAADVVKAAEKVGLKIDANYVYKVRSRLGAKPAAKAKLEAPKATKPAPAPKAAQSAPTPKAASTVPTAPKITGVSNDVAFKKLVVELGVARAEALVVEVKRKLAELFAGG
jgi:hypothetical protein